MLPEYLMNICQRKSSVEEYKKKKPPLKISTYQQSRGNKLHWIKQSSEVLVDKKQKRTRGVRGSDYSPAAALSEEKYIQC